MNHGEIEANQILDRYLMGRLSRVETDRFEEHFLGCPQCLDELELAGRMQAAARRAASEDASRLAAQRGLAVVAWLARRGRFVQLAVIVAALLPAAFLFRPSSLRPSSGSPPPVEGHLEQREAFAPRTGTPIIPLRPRRGSGSEAADSVLQLDLPRASRWLVFSIELERPLVSTYRIVLRRRTSGREVWRAEDLEPSASGQLTVSFHSSFFEDRDYLLTVHAVRPDGTTFLVGRHPFRVVSAP